MAKSRMPVEYWGCSCYFCGEGFLHYNHWRSYNGIHKVKTKRNTIIYFHEWCYEENLKRSKEQNG